MLNDILNEAKEKIESTYDVFLKDLTGIRTGKASTSLLDGIIADVHGSKMKLPQIASINVVNNKMLSVTVWDKSSVSAVKNAIASSHLGLNPIVEGQVLRLPLPDLTEERRKELVKAVKEYAERARVSSRNVRRNCITKVKSLEKDKVISEDEMHSSIKKIEKEIDKIDKDIEHTTEKKEKELLTV